MRQNRRIMRQNGCAMRHERRVAEAATTSLTQAAARPADTGAGGGSRTSIRHAPRCQ